MPIDKGESAAPRACCAEPARGPAGRPGAAPPGAGGGGAVLDRRGGDQGAGARRLAGGEPALRGGGAGAGGDAAGRLARPAPSSAPLGLVGVGLAYGATLLLFVLGNKLTTAANTIFLQSTAPLYVLLLAPWLLGEPVRRRDVAYMLALAVGLGLFFVGQRQPDALAPDPFTGNLLAVASGVTWALTLIGLRRVGRGGGAPVAAGGAPPPDLGAAAVLLGNAFAFAIALPFALADPAPLLAAGAADWAVVVYLGAIQIGLAYVLLTRAFRRVGALEASLLLLVEPVLNPIWTWLAHGEEPGRWALAGGAVILAATAGKAVLDARRHRPAGGIIAS
jgi:drug/metabolite transporter, DME family